ncbi:BCAM0308 family protein [Methylomagnum sp.]
MSHTQSPNLPHADRQDRRIQELIHDPYHTKKKLAEPTVCPECGAAYHAGRWQWHAAPTAAHHELCPACQRVRDHCPAGFLTLRGEFLAGHREEIEHLMRHVEQNQKAEHALQRIMGIDEPSDGGLLVTFTDPQLARAAGEAVHRAYQGELDFNYQENEFLLRVAWCR